MRRSKRARYARVIVGREGVEVVLPTRAPESMAAELVAEKRRWIDRALLKTQQAQSVVAGRRLIDGELLPVLDDVVRLRITTGHARAQARLLRIEAQPDQLRFEQVAGRPDLVVDGPCRVLSVTTPAGTSEQVREALGRWYRTAARSEVKSRLDATVARHGLSYSGLSVRGQKTRWASCSSAGKMSFNWRLLLAPAAVLDYVVEHEVAHLEVMDHSPRFWRLVEQRRPGFEAERRWLREHGDTLFL